MTAVAVGCRPRRSDREAPGASVQELLRGLPARRCRAPRAPFVWATLSRRWTASFRPSPIWPSGWRSTWRSTRTSLPRACSSPARFHQPLLEALLCLRQPGRPQLTVNGRAVPPCRRHQGLEPDAAGAPAPARGVPPAPGRLPGPPTDPVRRHIQALSDAEDTHHGSLNGLAGAAGAAAGPLHPAPDRPLSRPPGRSHAAPGPRQGRVASLRDRLRRPLTLARAARVGVHAAPLGGRSQAGRPRAPPHRRFRRNVRPVARAPRSTERRSTTT